MDRSVTPINVPASVVPYAPNYVPNYAPNYAPNIISRTVPPKIRRKLPPVVASKDNNPSSSADFNSFEESGTDLSSTDQDYEYDLGYIETDRIDPKQIDPNAVIYSANSAPYGEQYPSYLPKSMATMVSNFTTNHCLEIIIN